MLETLLIDRYKLIQLLGSGGFGQTFVAEDVQQPGLRCVVKQFKPISQDLTILDVARRLFLNEAKVLQKLGSHDRIPTLLNNFEANGQFYLVQEYVEGRSLNDELIVKRKLNESQVITLLRDVLEILDFVHQRQVIHRDIKPSNLIRRLQDDRFVLIDFGAVKEIGTQIRQLGEQTNLTIGIATQGYGPTEQLAGKPRFSSDLYALGMTAIQALTGLHPAQLPTHAVTGEVIWCDRADVTPWLAAILSKMVRYHFNDRFQSVAEAIAALGSSALIQSPTVQQTADWEAETVIRSTEMRRMSTVLLDLPVQPPVPPPAKARRALPLVVAIAGFVVSGLVAGVRQLGWLQPLELATFDRMTQVHPQPPVDDRLLVVGITEADIQKQNRFPLSDQVIANAIQQLQRHRPRAIGLDIFRDIPQPPGRSALLSALKAPNVIVITNLGAPTTPPPPTVPAQRVGFNDVVLDPDSVVRRNLMFADLPGSKEPFISFSLRLTNLYLVPQKVAIKSSPRDRTIAQIGTIELPPLTASVGGYQKMDDRGYQTMMQYRGQRGIQQVSLEAVLQGTVPPALITDRVVLIGTTASNAKDLFLTPYSPVESDTPRMPGVFVHAHKVSQFLSIALDKQIPIWFWSEPLEILWIAGWALVGGAVAWFIVQRPLVVLIGEGLLLVGLVGISYGIFLHSGWIPVVAPAIALVLSGAAVSAYRTHQRVKQISVSNSR